MVIADNVERTNWFEPTGKRERDMDGILLCYQSGLGARCVKGLIYGLENAEFPPDIHDMDLRMEKKRAVNSRPSRIRGTYRYIYYIYRVVATARAV